MGTVSKRWEESALRQAGPVSTDIRTKAGRVQIGGAAVDSLSFAEAVESIERHILEGRSPAYAVTPNAQHIVLLNEDQRLKGIYDQAEFVFADGASLLMAAKWLGRKFPERVTGVDLFQALCSSAAKRGFRVFLLGGQPGSAERAAAILQERNPGLKIAGTYCPAFGFENDQEEFRRVLETVKNSKCDLLFVGFGAPKQEYWIADNYAGLGVPLSMGIGGSFDMVAGVTPRAPNWMQRMGLEWLFRLMAEPKRLWKRYLIGNLKFMSIVRKQRLAAKN